MNALHALLALFAMASTGSQAQFAPLETKVRVDLLSFCHAKLVKDDITTVAYTFYARTAFTTSELLESSKGPSYSQVLAVLSAFLRNQRPFCRILHSQGPPIITACDACGSSERARARVLH